jgi:hypothetical protein
MASFVLLDIATLHEEQKLLPNFEHSVLYYIEIYIDHALNVNVQ